MTDPTADTSNERPFVSEDFLQGDVREGLARMRKRLLDLTARNRLLNFPQRPSKSALRVVDELPDQLYAQLIAGRTLKFRPVPSPQGMQAEPDLIAEDSATESNPVGQGRDRRVTAKEAAERLGLSTSYDLPAPAANGTAARHADNAIQTLHYREDLDALLRKISSAARLAIEETGSNMLYLIFGFLEWYEDDTSQQARMAPLLLLPATLEKDQADSGTALQRVRASGEDVLSNVSLQERLRRDFGVLLPSLTEDESPERYFARVAEITARFPRWKVRRQVTLSLLSFGKILMYKDLDPDTWPRGASPAEHERIGEFFRGIQRDAITFAQDYAIDDANEAGAVPMLVDEADSSQHSALIDALAGKNLVIEGPPGTGKSQTITNLIASALAAGKTVLFVSDKLAALTVVRDRLDRVGLGTFCLELHSHKSQKRQLLDDVAQRLAAYRSFRDPSHLEAKLASLTSDRAQLTSYVTLINTPYGALGWKLYDIIWGARRQRAALPFPPELLARVALAHASALTAPAYSDLLQLSSQFTTHLRNVLGAAEAVPLHPWSGVRNTSLTFTDADELSALVNDWLTACQGVLERIEETNETAGVGLVPHSLAELRELLDRVRSLPVSVDRIAVTLFPALRHRTTRAHVGDFVRWLGQYKSTIRAITGIAGVVPALSAGQLDEATRLAARAKELSPGAADLKELSSSAQACNAAAAALSTAREAIEAFSRLFEIEVPLRHDGAHVVLAAIDAIRTCPLEALRLRHPGLDASAARDQLAAFAREAEALRTQRTGLQQRLDLAFMPPLEELRAHVSATATPRWWSMLFKDYRSARRAYRVMCRDVRSTTPQLLRDDLRRLHDLARSEQRHSGNAQARSVSGPAFDGIDSPYGALLALVDWRNAVIRSLAPFGASYASVASSIVNAAEGSLRTVVESSAALAHALKSGMSALGSVAEYVRPAGATPEGADWTIAVRLLGELGRELTEVSDRLLGMALPAALRIERIPALGRLLTELQSVDQMILSAADVRSALGADFRGSETDVDQLLRTLALFESLDGADVPVALKEWLLDSRVEERLGHLRRSSEGLEVALVRLAAKWDAFVARTGATATEWFGTEAPDSMDLTQQAQRARRALAHRDTIPAWLDYVRAHAALADRGLLSVAELAERGRIDPDAVQPAVSFVVCESLVREAFEAHPQLARFSGLSHEDVRSRFAKYDRECISLYRQRAARMIDARTVPAGIGHGSVRTYTERHLLEHEISKQRAFVPLRQLMFRAGRALQALKPCFMMGPLSVAQYLTPGALKFDLVVMDEASQLRPEDALGAIARGTQVIVVGDRMQLPPTSFFDRIGDEEEEDQEDAGAVTEAESILDIASATYQPSRMLRWHYRSRHGSLIAFSNKEFYQGRLVVFPSPVPVSATDGVKLVHVRDGIYERSRNIREARRVVSTAVRFMESNPTRSLGIVAMNVAQRELIEDLFEEAARQSPVAQRYIEERQSGLEPFFVKNLENVQGDERDVIYISNTYGPSPNGQVFQRFGPINGPTGHRRLNVLFTRARHRVVLFSSMLSEHVITQPSSSWGLRAFKGYLHFAQTGILHSASFSGREPDSDFEVEVAEALRSRGYDAVAQVGVSGYFLDLAVRHPEKPDAFLLGIECDGASYHSGLSARDRDRLRQQVLEGLGWKIHRIWSTDWFKQPKNELDRVVRRIEMALREEATARAAFIEDVDAEQQVESAVLEEGEAWAGELAVQPFSEIEARESLTALANEALASFPDGRADAFVLRPEMIELLVKLKPSSKDDWFRKIPIDARLDTDGNQVSAFLPQILQITSRMSK